MNETEIDQPAGSQLRRLACWYFFYFAFVGAFAPFFTLYLQDIGQSAWEIAVLMSVPQIMRLLSPSIWGWLADRLGRRATVVQLAALGAALSFCGFFLTRDFPSLVVVMAMVWFFWSAALPLVEALTLDRLAGHTERYGRVRLWGSVGFIASVVSLGALLDYLPIASVLWVCLVILVSVLASAMTLEETKLGAGGEALPLFERLRQPAVLALLAACFFMSVAHGPLYVFFSIHLVENGYDKMAVGAYWSIGVVAEIIVFMSMPRLLRYFTLRNILLASFMLAVVRFLLIAWFVEHSLLLLVAQILHGATFGAFHAGAMAVLIRWFEPVQQARAQGVYGSISFGAGGMAGGLIGGMAWEGFGPGLTYSFAAFFAACGWILIYRFMSADLLETKG